MSQTQIVVTLVSALITAGFGGGVVALVMLPKQRRQMDANTAKIVVDAASVMIDQLQEETNAARVETRAAKQEATDARAEVRKLRQDVAELRDEVHRLTADLADRDRTIAALRRAR